MVDYCSIYPAYSSLINFIFNINSLILLVIILSKTLQIELAKSIGCQFFQHFLSPFLYIGMIFT